MMHQILRSLSVILSSWNVSFSLTAYYYAGFFNCCSYISVHSYPHSSNFSFVNKLVKLIYFYPFNTQIGKCTFPHFPSSRTRSVVHTYIQFTLCILFFCKCLCSAAVGVVCDYVFLDESLMWR